MTRIKHCGQASAALAQEVGTDSDISRRTGLYQYLYSTSFNFDMASSPSKTQLLAAYRHLYRGLLHAVQFAVPARYTARDSLRNAFRRGHVADYDPLKIERTLEFLDGAAQQKGPEHHLLKNLVQVAGKRNSSRRTNFARSHHTDHDASDSLHSSVYTHYDMTVAMLNNSMGLCLR